MAVAASVDLRRRVVEAYQRGGVTYAEVAERFAVGEASVSRWLRLSRENGTVQPRPHRGGRERLISPQQEEIVRKLVLEHPDWSEAELTQTLREQFEIVASAVTVGRVIRRLGFSVKKKRFSPPSAIVPTSSAAAESTTSESEGSPLRVWFLWTKRVRTRR